MLKCFFSVAIVCFLLFIFQDLSGPEGVRTLDHLVKSQMLYLAELQAHYRLGLKLYNTLLVIYRTLSNIAIETAYPLY
jgi:hypothetical protein